MLPLMGDDIGQGPAEPNAAKTDGPFADLGPCPEHAGIEDQVRTQ